MHYILYLKTLFVQKNSMLIKNILSIILSSVFALSVSFYLNLYTSFKSQNFVFALLFFSIICFILNIIYFKYKKSKTFTELILVSISIKLLLSFIGIFIYSVFYPTGFFAFSIHFLCYYILFTIFEIGYLLRLIKTANNS